MIRWLRPIRRALAGESGIAVPIALAVMVIGLSLAAAAVAVAINANTLTRRDGNAKSAQEAADAGLRAAIFRLNEYRPGSNACPTQPTPTAVGSNGLCAADGPESLGNNATFTYWISRALQEDDLCAGLTVDSSASDVAQRCITALGTVNGVSERLQERVAAYTSTPVFPTAIFGTKSVTISNNETIVSDTPGFPALLGTNGVLNVGGVGGGTTQIDGYALPPEASLQLGSNVTNVGPTTPMTAPYPIPTAINPGTTSQNTSAPYDTPSTSQGGTCSEPASWSGAWTQTNCDYRILCPDVQSCDSHSGSIVFDAVNRTLYLANNSSLVLGGGFYNFCSLYMNNNSQITIAPGAKVSIFIDSPYDHSACANTNSLNGVAPGTFTMTQNSTFNAGGSALNAQIYVYGDNVNTPPTNNVVLSNNGNVAFALAAPNSNVNVSPSNNTIYKGAIVGYSVTIGNAGHFTYEADTNSLQSGSLQLYYRAYWEQCAGPGTPSAPTTGC